MRTATNKKERIREKKIFPRIRNFSKKEDSFFQKRLDKKARLLYNIRAVGNAALAQLDRVFGYEPKGRGFESLTPRHESASFGKQMGRFWQ